MSRKSEQGWKLADGYRDELVKAKARIAELEAENKRLSKVIREKHLFAGLGCRRCATVGNEDTDYSGWTFNEGEGWLCPKHTEAELAALKGRRCETCAERGGPDWNRYVCLLDDNCAADFYCSFWAARAEEGSGDEP